MHDVLEVTQDVKPGKEESPPKCQLDSICFLNLRIVDTS